MQSVSPEVAKKKKLTLRSSARKAGFPTYQFLLIELNHKLILTLLLILTLKIELVPKCSIIGRNSDRCLKRL